MNDVQRRQFIYANARRLGIDPRAAVAVALSEGAFSGAIGDAGTSFGPFQLHRGGALPSHVANPQRWANSAPGLLFALRQIAGVSRGLRGRKAIASIVRRFERPAAPGAEIQRALGYYRGMPAGAAMPAGGGGRIRGGGRGGRPVLQPIKLSPQGLNFADPSATLKALAGKPSYLTQGGKPYSSGYAFGGAATPQLTPNRMTAQGVSTADLYSQIEATRKRLLAA